MNENLRLELLGSVQLIASPISNLLWSFFPQIGGLLYLGF
jgi:hypothetical protein